MHRGCNTIFQHEIFWQWFNLDNTAYDINNVQFRGNHTSVYGSNSYEEEVNDDIELLHDVSFGNVEGTDDGEDQKKDLSPSMRM